MSIQPLIYIKETHRANANPQTKFKIRSTVLKDNLITRISNILIQ